MRPKGKLFALFAVFAAIGLVTASGAFTTVSADRTVTVDTAGDANALLGLEANSSGNGAYANTEGNQIVIDFSANNLPTNGGNSADGVNVDAETEADDVFNVTNNGAQDIYFYVETSGSSSVDVTLYDGADPSSGNLTGTSNYIQINSGNQDSIGVSINTTGVTSTSEFNETVTIIATSEDPTA
jgi:hypothetical protein